MATAATGGQIRQLVSGAKKSRSNRVYYERCFNSNDLFAAGIVQTPDKSAYDRPALEKTRNESLHYFGFDQKGSHFDLELSILSLYPNTQTTTKEQLDEESNWRLANVKFLYLNAESKCEYSYEAEQLLDYQTKRTSEPSGAQHETRDIYRVGSLSVEIISPFSLSRILFNGLLTAASRDEQDEAATRGGGGGKAKADDDSKGRQVPARLAISTHPTCDKMDYQYRFSCRHLSKRIQEATTLAAPSTSARQLLELALEDRIDQSLMFQGHLELLDNATKDERFIMWGAKVRRLIDPRKELGAAAAAAALAWSSPASKPTESLFLWAESGQQVHLSRPTDHPALVYGMIDNSFDYPSHLYDAKLFKCSKVVGADTTTTTTTTGQEQQQHEEEIPFGQLSSFANLLSGGGGDSTTFKIVLKGYKVKEYTIEILDHHRPFVGVSSSVAADSLLKARINGFDAWALVRVNDLAQRLKMAQSHLWTLNLADKRISFALASERLLGGKGNSLVELNRLIDDRPISTGQPQLACDGASVPRGLVVSCVAYQLWLQSSPLIVNSIRELDTTRRTLAARSIYLNPMSDKHLSLAQSQQILREQCRKTGLVLNSCPLPPVLRKHLYLKLVALFGEQALKDPPTAAVDEDDGANIAAASMTFAVRSSAVGEDSLETSAAGQMRTILDARGFEAICRSVVDCWSSQFSLEAVAYKTQNGLALDLPMAVVVQELVQCRAAGVATTCNPLTGNREQLEITANLGLGEGVVSGKQTDSIRLSLKTLAWDSSGLEEPIGFLGINDARESIIFKQADDHEGSCCLDDQQILSLANLLIWLRRNSSTKDREVEWGITTTTTTTTTAATRGEPNGNDGSPSSSSSSSSSSSRKSSATSGSRVPSFHIHLLQSRPLTHLARLDSSEIDHELDYGFTSPLDIVSRANLGEVMPGALSPMNLSFYLPLCSAQVTEKPCERNHTRRVFAADAFGFYGQMISLILNNTDTLARFATGKDGEKMDSFRTMIGTVADSISPEREAKLTLVAKERINSLSSTRRDGLAHIIAWDSGLASALLYKAKKAAKRTILTEDLNSIEQLIERLEQPPNANGQIKKNQQRQQKGRGSQPPSAAQDAHGQIWREIRSDIERLHARICTRTGPLNDAWKCHIRATVLSMAWNMICLQVITSQAAFPSELDSPEALHALSVLMRGGAPTESGDIAQLLDKLVSAGKGELLAAKELSLKQLHDHLCGSTSKPAQLYREFMKKNGHRSYKEFDFSTLTWADDPSYVIKSLAARLKVSADKNAVVTGDDFGETEANVLGKSLPGERDSERTSELLAKIDSGKAILTGYLLPRARNAVVRREQTKSHAIKMVDKYRRALRHLGALLCLEGRLPNAQLIFQLTIEELDQVVRLDEEARADLARLLYKARRRQQRARVLNQVLFKRPTVDFHEMVRTIRQVSDPAAAGERAAVAEGSTGGAAGEQAANDGGKQLVRGMTSCAGCVTGRACVVNSLEDMDQIEPNDILITYSIDISWSVYFFTLAGIVTEVGGIVSHGAVVAREYGIPTLCTAIDACSVFKTGQTVTLDANQGICYLAGQAPPANGAEPAALAHEELDAS